MTIKSVTNGHTLHAVRWHARAIGPEGRRAMPQEALTHCGARHGLSHSCPGAECKETPAVHTGGPDPHPRSGRQVSRRVRGAAGALGGGGQRHADWGGGRGRGGQAWRTPAAALTTSPALPEPTMLQEEATLPAALQQAAERTGNFCFRLFSIFQIPCYEHVFTYERTLSSLPETQ